MILYYFHSLDCTKCKFPDFTQYYFFPWLSTHVPDFCQVWNFPGFSLTTGHPVNSLTWNICGRFIPVCNAIFKIIIIIDLTIRQKTVNFACNHLYRTAELQKWVHMQNRCHIPITATHWTPTCIILPNWSITGAVNSNVVGHPTVINALSFIQ